MKKWKPWLPPKANQGLQQGGCVVFKGRDAALEHFDEVRVSSSGGCFMAHAHAHPTGVQSAAESACGTVALPVDLSSYTHTALACDLLTGRATSCWGA
jgi:hypothetical protein